MTAIGQVDTPDQAFWLILPLLAILACYTSVSAVFKAEMFPAGVRALGVGFPTPAPTPPSAAPRSTSLSGSSAPGPRAPSSGTSPVCASITLLVALAMPDTKARSLIVED
jgi:MHS family alpha-ketoglutarate permease-like MFS transporter